MIPLDDRLAADIFELTYREFASLKPADYRWRLIAPDVVHQLKTALAERWSLEKLAEYLHAEVEEAGLRLRRFVMSQRINEAGSGSDRISILFQEWLVRFEGDERRRKELALDLGRLLSSQLHFAAQNGERMEDVAAGLEGNDGAPPGAAASDKPFWGPQWKE